MKFIIIEVNDGGAERYTYSREEVAAYLQPWNSDHMAEEFSRFAWKPGCWMEFPCGWIFCVTASGC